MNKCVWTIETISKNQQYTPFRMTGITKHGYTSCGVGFVIEEPFAPLVCESCNKPIEIINEQA